MRDDPVGGPPFFVVGCGRSGTTLVRVILESHPDVAVPYESHFLPRMIRMWPRLTRSGRLDMDELMFQFGTRFHAMQLPPDDLQRRLKTLPRPDLRETVEQIYRSYADLRGRPRWGDKSPAYVSKLPILAAAFPDAQFVHVIRDGRSVALSYRDAPFGANTLLQSAALWKRRVEDGLRDGRPLGPDRYFELRYEHLASNPEHAIRGLCAFLGLEFHPAMLAPHEGRGPEVAAYPPAQGRLIEPIRPGLRDWRTEMSRHDVVVFEDVAGDLLAELGYEVTSRPGFLRTPFRRLGARVVFGTAWTKMRLVQRIARVRRRVLGRRLLGAARIR